MIMTMASFNSEDKILNQEVREGLFNNKPYIEAIASTHPIIFMDEPSVSQIGSSAYLTISENDVISMINEISEVIKSSGALSAMHCCGKCDWRIPIKTGVNIINFDAYTYGQNFNVYHKEISKFLDNGGKIAWGFVPTLNGEILRRLNTEKLTQKFQESVNYLTKNGINEKLILDNSLITSSCGAGGLSVKDAELAMHLVKELSDRLKSEE